MPLPTDTDIRKGIPVYSGFIQYFPDAIAAVAQLSRIGNDQHNPGQPLHWAKDKSTDELDALMRHMIDAQETERDSDGVMHLVKLAWRAMANLQRAADAGIDIFAQEEDDEAPLEQATFTCQNCQSDYQSTSELQVCPACIDDYIARLQA